MSTCVWKSLLFIYSTCGIYIYFYFESVGYSIGFVNTQFRQASRNYYVSRVYFKIYLKSLL